MKAVEIQDSFGLEQLRVVEREVPVVGRGQVRIRVKAASLNYRDLLMVRGLYNPRQPLPLVPCSDGVGVVEEVGEGVSRVAVGDRVCPLFAQKWFGGEPTHEAIRSTLGGPLDGMLMQEKVMSEESLVKVPDYLSDEEAATLPCAALTAWSALSLGGLQAGQTVLLQGTGGVSMFALQFAKAMGARVIITSSQDEKLEKAKALGADEVINYKSTPEWGKVARGLTEKQGVDHIVEVGGAQTLKQSLRAIRVGGHISMIGVLSGVASEINVLPILMQQVRVQGVLVGSREGFESMNRAMAQHEIRPVLDKTFALEEVPEALQYMADGKHFGKICISL
jgi:NADPH:quinone reductase-like Zn-dependent oxidoreductase